MGNLRFKKIEINHKQMKMALAISVMSLVITFGITCIAATSAKLLESNTNDENISLFVRGMQYDENFTVQIGTSNVSSVETMVLSELDMPIQTLVMIDNSTSIPEKDRIKISEFIQNLILNKLSNEEISIVTFSENISVITDYTRDYNLLKNALESIEYEEQETYFTDVLYDLIADKFVDNTEDIFRRIIVVSDGVDNKSIGYTNDELYSLLKEYPIPIYTIGSLTGNNNKELENMFAISRITSVDYFLLDDVEDTLSITDVLKQDKDIIKIVITPIEEVMDGSRKVVKITFEDGSSVSSEIDMPQKLNIVSEETVEETTEEVTTEEGIVEEIVEEAVGTEIPNDETSEYGVEEANYRTIFALVILLVIFALIIIIGIIITIIVFNRKKDKKTNEDTFTQNVINNGSEKKPEFENAIENIEDGKTICVFDKPLSYHIVFTDINIPNKSFYVQLDNSVIIGRRVGSCDVVLDYDNSVSGNHCEILTRNGKFYVKDLQSSNGTFINDCLVMNEKEIFSGDIVRLGRLEMRFDVR